MIRNYNIYVNHQEGAITQTEGDGSFFLGDNNQITVIPSGEEELHISISGNVPGCGTYIAELERDAETNNYILKSKDLNGFLVKIGKVNCNIHISNVDGERLTTLPFQITSLISYDREGSAITSPTDVKNLNDFYIALDVIKELNITEIEEAVEIVESLDIQKIEEALEIIDSLDRKVEELDQTIANAKETDVELAATLTLIKEMLESGELKGEPGEKGDPGGKGDPGDDYILTENDKTEIADLVYAMFTNGEEVRF